MKYFKKVEINKWQFRKSVILLYITFLPSIFVHSQTKDSTDFFNQTVSKENYNKNLTLDLAIQDKIAGLFVAGKSGMPDEGAYLNFRGLHSFVASNSPLIVINGIPYFGNEDASKVINGYSRSLFSAMNVDDIRSIKFLKGADAAMFGSLGSNGVLYIETEQATSDNLDTRITFSGKYGLRLPNQTIPVLGVDGYKNYLQDIGTTCYGSMTSLLTDYPFLNTPDNYFSYLFNNNTDWYSEIQSPTFITDNVFRVEGGDAIAKYNLSFGYTSDGGVIGQTKSDRYNTSINTNIMVSRKVNIFANVGLAYITSKLQEQGKSYGTNPLLAAGFAMPMISPYKKESDGNLLNRYATYDEWNVNTNPTFAYENVSNPLAIVNTLNATDKIYDANIRLGSNYRPNRYLTFSGILNIYLNYTEEGNFTPGITSKAIIPQYYGVGFNTVREGVIKGRTDFYGINAEYQRTLDSIHFIKGSVGMRYMGHNLESDLAWGYNTPNDNHSTLDKVTEHKTIIGNNIEWKWLNYYINGEYVFNNRIKASFNLSIDGTSVSGKDAPRFNLFPSGGVSAYLKNVLKLPKAINMLNLSVNVSQTGNSRFSSNYAKNYYQNSNLFNLGTIIRSNVPNTKLECEKNNQIDFGLDAAFLNNLFYIKANYYTEKAYDLLVARNISRVYGSSSYYDNTGEIATHGIELSFRINPLRTSNFNWSIGASVANAISEIKSLGNSDELFIRFTDYNNDDALVIMRKGESPYQFYGYRTNGIYATSTQAQASGLKNIYGNDYVAGDVVFVNENNEDNVINAKDKVLLGSATPDFFGSINTSFRFKKITLIADLGYSVGNEAYNSVRRELESMSTFHNQSISVQNRWQVEGQNAELPRAAYGDPAGNNVFSDRWIEDASYIKLRNLTLKYDFGRLLKICQSGTVYVSGQNLFTLTKYLGGDPELSYNYASYMQGFDYAKVALSRTVLFGFQLYF